MARNSGAAAANGDLLFCDADTRLTKGPWHICKTIDTGVDAVCGVYSPNPLNPGFTEGYKAAFDTTTSLNAGCALQHFFGLLCRSQCTGISSGGGFNESLTAKMEYETRSLVGACLNITDGHQP